MPLSFLTNLDEQEFKEFLREAIKEVLSEVLPTVKEDTADILDAQQAAKFLRLKLNTIYEKTSRKLIPHFKQGNKLLFKRSELLEWLTRGKIKTRDELAGNAETYLLTGDKSK